MSRVHDPLGTYWADLARGEHCHDFYFISVSHRIGLSPYINMYYAFWPHDTVEYCMTATRC